MNPFDFFALLGLSAFVGTYWPLILCFGMLIMAYKLSMAYASNTDAERSGYQSMKARFVIRMVYIALGISLVSIGYWFEWHIRLQEVYVSGNDKMSEIYQTAKEGLTNK